MPNHALQPYLELVEFLGKALGPNYEVALHDMTARDYAIIAIANGHVSGRNIGAPLTATALKILMDKSYLTEDSRFNYRSVSVSGKTLRSSTHFIKKNGNLIGMLCVNFDDSKYQAMADDLLRLCHPDSFVQKHYQFDENLVIASHSADIESPEQFRGAAHGVAADAVQEKLERFGMRKEKLSYADRLKVISELNNEGLFLLKGAVKEIADELNCSPVSVYRYLSQAKKKDEEENRTVQI